MSNGIELAEIAMIGDLARLEVISHNLANVATTAFRRDVVSSAPAEIPRFELAGPVSPFPQDPATPRMERRTVHEPGTLRFTGNPLDLAIEGDAFFAVETAAGEAYARSGAFALDAAGRLVTAAGWPVLTLGGPLRLDAAEPEIDRQGRVWQGEDLVGQLRLVRFAEPALLNGTGGGHFTAGARAGLIEDAGESLLRQGYLENSNVQVSHEMVRLLELIRHFEAAQRVIRGYDDMLGTAVTTIADF